MDGQQPPEQAGFRRKYSTSDHLLTLVLIQEKTDEWQLPLWTATLDFKKAFDTVSHEALWSALAAQSVPTGYIDLLTRLYHSQTATVHTDKPSREFNIKRGTKQGDPLSSLLFNALSEQIFRCIQPIWEKKGYGVRLSLTSRSLTNLRFADDVILFAKSQKQITTMLSDIQREAMRTGLELHPDKTKILHNQRNRKTRQQPETVRINDSHIEILPHTAHQKYLGRKFTFDQTHSAEIDNRIASGWRKFHLFKQELTTRSYSLAGRLRLFHGTVTPTVLYACSAWTMTTDLCNRIRRAQRQMLRMILGSPRRRTTPQPTCPPTPTANSTDVDPNPNDVDSDASSTKLPPVEEEQSLEPWADWVQRCTHEAEQQLRKLGIQDWNSIQKQRKTKTAAHIATEQHKWTHHALQWDPQTTHPVAHRRQARPKTRWTDDLKNDASPTPPITQDRSD